MIAKPSRKQALSVYHMQCKFFGIIEIPAWRLKKMNAKEIYKKCESDYRNQTYDKREALKKSLGVGL